MGCLGILLTMWPSSPSPRIHFNHRSLCKNSCLLQIYLIKAGSFMTWWNVFPLCIALSFLLADVTLLGTEIDSRSQEKCSRTGNISEIIPSIRLYWSTLCTMYCLHTSAARLLLHFTSTSGWVSGSRLWAWSLESLIITLDMQLDISHHLRYLSKFTKNLQNILILY